MTVNKNVVTLLKGAKCPFCDEAHRELPFKFRQVREHLIVVQLAEGELHVHGPISNKPLMREMIRVIGREAGIEIEDED